MLYTSKSIALRVLEFAANVSIDLIPASLAITVYFIPEQSWKEFSASELPADWQHSPAHSETKLFGSEFFPDVKYLVLKVPSAAIPLEYNYIINPLHPDFKKVKLRQVHPFTFDTRIKQ